MSKRWAIAAVALVTLPILAGSAAFARSQPARTQPDPLQFDGRWSVSVITNSASPVSLVAAACRSLASLARPVPWGPVPWGPVP